MFLKKEKETVIIIYKTIDNKHINPYIESGNGYRKESSYNCRPQDNEINEAY